MYMLLESPEAIAREWEKYAGYTVRPQPSTVDYYWEIINEIAPDEQHALLGATPEVRTLYQRAEKSLTLLERSAEMVNAMGMLTIAGVGLADNELWAPVDWRSMINSCEQRFRLMIGDDAINMLQWHEFDDFLFQVANLLEENGEFICHLLIQPELKLRRQSVAMVAEDYFNGVIKNKYDLASRLNYLCYDDVTLQMGWQSTIEKIGLSNLAQFKPMFDFVETFAACNSRFTCPPQYEFEKLVEKYFVIIEVFYSAEHAFCDFEPVYRLKKRG